MCAVGVLWVCTTGDCRQREETPKIDTTTFVPLRQRSIEGHQDDCRDNAGKSFSLDMVQSVKPIGLHNVCKFWMIKDSCFSLRKIAKGLEKPIVNSVD